MGKRKLFEDFRQRKKCGRNARLRSTDWDHIAVYEKIPGVSAEGLIKALGVAR